MKNIKISELRKYLKEKNEKELIDEIVELFKNHSSVKNQYNILLNPEIETQIFEQNINKVRSYFYPTKGGKTLDYASIKNLITDFEKTAQNKIYIADLMITFVEEGVEHMNDFGYYDAKLYNRIIDFFYKGLKVISANDLEETFKDRCYEIVNESYNLNGDFSDEMNTLFYDFIDYGENEG